MRNVRPRAIANLTLAIGGCVGLLSVLVYGFGTLPALGSTFNPGTGIWRAAPDSTMPHNQTLLLPGLQNQAAVVFEANGTAHIEAASDHDLFFGLGYLHATYRLFEMDVLRRQGEGRLSQVLGPKALPVDKFELDLGLKRTAEAEWSSLSTSDPLRAVLQAYAQGVNRRIESDLEAGTLPLLFRLAGYRPELWSPLDTLVVKGYLSQVLAFQIAPLQYALLAKSLGIQRTMQWFPVLPVNAQMPYAPTVPAGTEPAVVATPVLSQAAERTAGALIDRISQLPVWAFHREGNSNSWAINGTKSATGQALMAGDPHLNLTLPSIWYQVELKSPRYAVSGVTIPGVPVVMIGKNRHISWSITNTQNQSTFFYLEQTDPSNRERYLWNGAWRRFQTLDYDIAVKGKRTVHYQVRVSVHGPVLISDGGALTVQWMGGVPSNALGAFLRVSRAANFGEFKDALRLWNAPPQTFVYADDQGHIGLIAPGIYAIVKHGAPWFPLPGDGRSDIVGRITFDDIPQVYDPPTHFVSSANQRPVASAYPYYIGTALDNFDAGYRAEEIARVLSQGDKLSAKDMERLQLNDRDYLAGRVVPRLLEVIKSRSLSPEETSAGNLLASWDGTMAATSPAATIWATFWSAYFDQTFEPWWDAYRVGVTRLDVSVPLEEDLEAWTLSDPTNPAFSIPGGPTRTSDEVMAGAFRTTIEALTRQLGSNLNRWEWGKLHSRQIRSLFNLSGLSYGPFPSPGDGRTPDAAGGLPSSNGPSWRFIVDWRNERAYGIYPGGQSESPVSGWYDNQIHTWVIGDYFALLTASQVPVEQRRATWRLEP